MSAPYTLREQPWTIRAFQHGDEEALCALFARVFRRPITREEWWWKHHAQPSPAPNVWLALHDQKPIFHTSGIPTPYKLRNDERVAMVSVDTMTDPVWRRRGLLTAVGKVAYDAYRAAHLPFVIGIINDKWGSRANALGWQEVFPLVWQIRALRPEMLLARKLNAPALKRYSSIFNGWNAFWDRRVPCDPQIRVEWTKTADARFDTLWERARDSYSFSIVRDRAWAKWRYFDSPHIQYRVAWAEKDRTPLGYAATRVIENEGERIGVIAELFVARNDHATLGALLHFLLRTWRAQGFTQAATVNAPQSWMYRAFRRAGFLWSVGAFDVQMLPLTPTLPLDLMRDPANWFMAGGDYDDV